MTMIEQGKIELLAKPVYNPREIRDKLDVDQNMLLSPQTPQPEIEDGTILDCLSHNGIFTAEECARIILEHSPKKWSEAGLLSSATDDTKYVNNDYRHTKNSWISKTEDSLWIFDKMLALVMSANQFKYKFEIDHFEAIQLAKYEEGMHYDWHADLGAGRAGNRKLSVSVQLTARDDYSGGDLLLDIGAADPYVAPRDVGSVTVFPSFVSHKVTPVKKGTRYSLVVWASGTTRFR